MRPSICTSFDYSVLFPRAVALLQEAGFDWVSLGASPKHSGHDTAAGRAALKTLVAAHGIRIDSVHAPFPEGDRLFSVDDAERLESVRLCKMAIDTALDVDGRVVVIHLIPYGIPEGPVRQQMIAQGRRSVEALATYAAKQRVTLALENGQKPDYDQVLAALLTEFDGDPVGFCYDSGHENVQGKCFELLQRFGHRLATVHIHDNLGTDSHMLPYEGNIDWERFRKVFHGLGYSGNLILEAGIGNSQFKDPAVFLAEARKRAEKLARPPA